MIELTMANFNEVVAANPMMVVDFKASWCGPCKMFAPIFAKVDKDFPDILFATVDIDQAQQIARHFGVRSVPTIGIIKNNSMIWQKPGVMNAKQLASVINEQLNEPSFVTAYAPPPRG